MWREIDPHLLLYAFLPALLFGDAMSLNMHLEMKCFSQCLLLACPGVLVGTALTACVGKYVFPYDWSWHTSLAFGSILAATDPVAVVALLKSLGASPKLTMLITGESLMNDGTAMVLFTLFFEMAKGREYTIRQIIEFFCQMALGGPLFGIMMGYIALKWLSIANHKADEQDYIIQISITLSCAYLTFFLAEGECGVSGVLATICAAEVLAGYAWPKVLNPHSMHHVWHAIEFLGNTIIFVLAGVIIGDTMYSRSEHIGWSDVGWLGVLFVLSNLIRYAMLIMFYPMLNSMGYGITLNELIVMGWGGLRGAVGLALAIVVDQEAKQEGSKIESIDGSRIMFMVGGFASLTLLVNGTTTAMLLTKLGMIEMPETKKALLTNVKDRIHRRAKMVYEKHAGISDVEFMKHDPTEVQLYCSVLKAEEAKPQITEKQRTRSIDGVGLMEKTGRSGRNARRASALGNLPEEQATALREMDNSEVDILTQLANAELDQPMMANVRQVFLHVVKSRYWEQIHEGTLPGDSDAAIALLTSVDVALDYSDTHLADWEKLADSCEVPAYAVALLVWLDSFLPSWIEADNWLQDWLVYSRKETAYYIVSCFTDAHRHAQKTIATYFGEGEDVDTPEEYKVIAESKQQIENAQKVISEMDKDMVTSAVSKQVLIDRMHSTINRGYGDVGCVEAGTNSTLHTYALHPPIANSHPSYLAHLLSPSSPLLPLLSSPLLSSPLLSSPLLSSSSLLLPSPPLPSPPLPSPPLLPSGCWDHPGERAPVHFGADGVGCD
jgi:NhaP-type Na+/H+ or K+/H+ antiporter